NRVGRETENHLRGESEKSGAGTPGQNRRDRVPHQTISGLVVVRAPAFSQGAGRAHANRAGKFASSPAGAGEIAPASRPARTTRAGAGRRTVRVPACHLSHQGK